MHDGPRTAIQLAGDFAVTRQAVVKHLQALADAGLAVGDRLGREVRYRATTEPLVVAIDWLRGASVAWDRRTNRLTGRP